MKKKDVPQDAGLSDRWHRIAYAVDHDGDYTQVESDGCDSVNITNAQAWDVVDDRIKNVRQQISEGKLSLLAFHMTACQMDETLLSRYSSFYKWQIKRHLQPKYFNKLDQKILQEYADIFEISVDELLTLPDLKQSPK